jgi:hypothetical protein
MTALDDVFLMQFTGVLNGQTIISTFHYTITALNVSTSETVACNRLISFAEQEDGLRDQYLAVAPLNYTLAQISCQKILPARYRRIQTAENLPGLRGTSPVSNVALVIERFGPMANRANIGSLHVPCSPGNAVGGTWDAPTLADATALSIAMTTALEDEDGNIYRPCLVAAWQGVPTPLPTPKIISGTIVHTASRVVRRRTVGVGI